MTFLAVRMLWVSLTTSVVLLPLLLFAGRLHRRYRAGSCYVLWLLLCVRLLIPIWPTFPQPVLTVELPQGTVVEAVVPGNGANVVYESAGQSPDSDHTRPVSGRNALGLVWLGGTAVTLLWQGVCYRAFRKRVLKGAVRLEEDGKLCREMGGSVPVLRGETDTPVTFGVLRPVVVLPVNTPGEDLPMILRHELCHIRRRDLWVKQLFLLCSCVHWFNPLVRRLGRTAGETMELCCDGTVVAGKDTAFRRRYGQVLLSNAAGRGCAYAAEFGSVDLKGRLMNLFIRKKRGAALVCAAVCAGLSMASLVGCEVSAAHTDVVSPSASQSVPPVIPVEEVPADVSAPVEQETGWLWPVEGYDCLTSLFGERTHPVTGDKSSHDGVDIPAPEGKAVLAAADGVVLEAGYDKRYGNYVLLEHPEGVRTLYGCMMMGLVESGAAVEQGCPIGIVGSTGMSTGAHLHFGVEDAQGELLDPLDFYPGLTVTLER